GLKLGAMELSVGGSYCRLGVRRRSGYRAFMQLGSCGERVAPHRSASQEGKINDSNTRLDRDRSAAANPRSACNRWNGNAQAAQKLYIEHRRAVQSSSERTDEQETRGRGGPFRPSSCVDHVIPW